MVRLQPAAFLLAAALAAPAAGAKPAPAHAGGRGSQTATRNPATLRITGEDHDGYGRLIFPTRGRYGYTVMVDGDDVVVGYTGAQWAIAPAMTPRNVAQLKITSSRTVIVPRPGGKIRTRRIGNTLAVEVLDPPETTAQVAPAAATVPPPVTISPVAAVAAVASVAATPLPPVDAEAKAASVAAILTPSAALIQLVADSPQPAILVPADSTVGLAAFRLGGDMVLVLDAPLTLATSALTNDPVFGRATIEKTQDATVIRIPLAEPASLHLSRDPKGWAVTAVPTAEALLGIAPRLVDDSAGRARLQLPVMQPSRVVTIVNHETGTRILVGTQGRSGQGIANERSMVQLTLIPTLQGVAATVRSDDMILRRDTESFSLVAGPHAGGTDLTSMQAMPAAAPGSTMLARMFDFADLPTAALIDRVNERIAATADAPAMSRSGPRQRVAEAMVTLGLGTEAQAVLDMAVEADPAMADRPETIALRAIAAVVAGRLEAARGLADPRLSGTAEITLWRGLLAATRDDTSTVAARNLASTLPLLLAYPRQLRERFLPLALQTLALGGQVPVARSVLAKFPDDPALDLARGMMLEMGGEADAALRAYALVAGRSDRLPRYTALVRTVGIQAGRGELGPKEAADALDQALYAWRGPKEELELRIHMADLRRQTGQWHEAITLLREARTALPDARAQVDSELAGIFTALFGGGAADRMAPSDFVALYDENTDLLRTAPWSEAAGNALVSRLVALDLLGRADPVLAQMITQATDPVKRALLGARLASVRLSADDPAGALAALSDTVPPPNPSAVPLLGQDIIQTRQLLYARAESLRGNVDMALDMLTALATADADDLRANLYSGRKDWKGAVAALADLEQKRLPPAGGALTPDQQAIVMRQASAATLAGDQATIDRLRDTRGEAMAKGPSADAFRLITSPTVSRTADLPRAFDEIRMAKQLPRELGTVARP